MFFGQVTGSMHIATIRYQPNTLMRLGGGVNLLEKTIIISFSRLQHPRKDFKPPAGRYLPTCWWWYAPLSLSAEILFAVICSMVGSIIPYKLNSYFTNYVANDCHWHPLCKLSFEACQDSSSYHSIVTISNYMISHHYISNIIQQWFWSFPIP